MRGYGTRRCAAPLLLHHRSSLRARHRRAPRAARADRRHRARARRSATGSGASVRESPRGRRSTLVHAVHPAGYVRGDRGGRAPPAAARSTPTRSSPRAPTRRRCTRPAARRRSSTRCWAATARASAPRCTARRATTPSRRARWASACSTTSRSPRGGRSIAHGRRAGADPRLGRPPRQRDQRHLPRDPACCSCRIHQSPLYPGHGPGVRRRVRAGRGLHGQPAGAGGDGRRGLRARSSSTSSCPLGRALRARSSCCSRPASTRTCDDPLAGCRVTEAGFAADGGERAAGWPTSSTCRSGWCSRAATTSTRWPSRRWRRSRWSAPTSLRSTRPVALHPLAAQAAGRLAERWPLVGAVAG